MVKCFVGCPSVGICFSRDGIGVMGFREEGQRNKMPYSSHQSQGTNEQHDSCLSGLAFTSWLRTCVIFLHRKAACSCPKISFLEGSRCVQPVWEAGVSLQVKGLHQELGILLHRRLSLPLNH